MAITMMSTSSTRIVPTPAMDTITATASLEGRLRPSAELAVWVCVWCVWVWVVCVCLGWCVGVGVGGVCVWGGVWECVWGWWCTVCIQYRR